MAENKMLSPANFFSGNDFLAIRNKEYCRQLMQLNDETILKGLILSEADVRDLVDTRNKSLADNGRFEIGVETVTKIIDRFSESSFIYQSNYAETINELVEIFYYIKTEAADKISDNALLDMMWDFYENKCAGSIELMTGRELEILLRYIHGDRKIYTLDEEDDYNAEPEGMERNEYNQQPE
jgi:hypothetical protein